MDHFPLDTNTTDPVTKYAGGIVVPDHMEATFRLDMVVYHLRGLYVKKQDPPPRPNAGRTVLKPPTLRKRARDAARLRAQLSSVKRRLRSPSRVPRRLRSKRSCSVR